MSIIQSFKTNVLQFLDELIEHFPNEGDFILARLLLRDQVDPTFLINAFVKELYRIPPR